MAAALRRLWRRKKYLSDDNAWRENKARIPHGLSVAGAAWRICGDNGTQQRNKIDIASIFSWGEYIFDINSRRETQK